MPHPNANRLVLCRLDDGKIEHTVLTGAPNLFPFKGKGSLEEPIKVAYAKEGARIYDGHQPGQVEMTLKRAKIRGVESYSMACSEKELGISEEHEGIIFLDDDAPVGTSLADYMGDVVFDISITPNMARNANILGVAREIAAITNQPLRKPNYEFKSEGPPIDGKVDIKIQNPELNPRFVLGLIQDVKIEPSPYWVQLRLWNAGMRPVNNIVDATNYVMLETGEPLHAFDYDVLLKRSSGKRPTIITRTANPGERLTTLDEVDRELDEFNVLVCDTAGALSIAGVMGGAESEVNENTRNVLLEGASWNFINIRKTSTSQRLQSEASYRFSRGVHPAMAECGVRRGLELMRQLSAGTVCQGLVDNYPLPPKDPSVELTITEVERWLGIRLSAEEIAKILARLEFQVEINDQTIRAVTPDHRLDIGEGMTGVADLLEEVARIYGYERIPETRLADELPPQRGNLHLEREELVRDHLVGLGLQEVISLRMTSPDREARRLPLNAPPDDNPYLQIANPIAIDRRVLRHSLLSSVLEVVERNARIRQRIALFEMGPIFMVSEESELPDESQRLVIILTGPRALPTWQSADTTPMDLFDLKGIVTSLLDKLHVGETSYKAVQHPTFHPGKCASVSLGDKQLGVIGELHPQVSENYELPPSPLLAAELDLDLLFESIPDRYEVQPVPTYPPVLEDLAIVVDEDITANHVEEVIRNAAGKVITKVLLFDVYRGEQIGDGKKSLAYNLTYQAKDRTLKDKEVAKVRQRIIHNLEKTLNAQIRS
jgi:phenylalanyl-tRNA synthetase beta chain